MTNQWLTIGQIANHLQVSREKVYKMCQNEKIPAYKVGGQWRFDVKEIDEWVRQSRRQKQKCKN